MDPTTPFVFVSYSSIDGRDAMRLAKRLESAGIAYFLDKKRINLGDNFKAEISEGLQKATDLVLIASPASLDSPWVFFELGQAVAFNCRILTWLTYPKLKLPAFLTDFQHANSIGQLIAYLQHRSNKARSPMSLLLPTAKNRRHGAPIELLPSARMKEFLAHAPNTWYGGNVAIDGAMELYTFPDHANRYGGIIPEQLTTVVTEEEWSDLARRQLSAQRLAALGAELRSWIGSRRAKPNRIRYLVEPPKQMVLDNNEFQMTIGNSDYFTMRTIASLSKKSHETTDGGPIARIFDSWWTNPLSRFEATTVPYHISALGVLFVTDPHSKCRYLILTLPNSLRVPLVSGWNVSFAEQMWAPSPPAQREPWWKPYVSDLNINSPTSRTGDRDIWATVKRGLYEELGIGESDLSVTPRLVMSCIEQDMHFVGFVFVLQATLTLADLQTRRLSSPDKEIGLIAAYPIDGVAPDGTRFDASAQLTSLLASDQFDGGPYLIPCPGPSVVGGWHLSSRLRIYAAARHLEGNGFLEYAIPTSLSMDA